MNFELIMMIYVVQVIVDICYRDDLISMWFRL